MHAYVSLENAARCNAVTPLAFAPYSLQLLSWITPPQAAQGGVLLISYVPNLEPSELLYSLSFRIRVLFTSLRIWCELVSIKFVQRSDHLQSIFGVLECQPGAPEAQQVWQKQVEYNPESARGAPGNEQKKPHRRT